MNQDKTDKSAGEQQWPGVLDAMVAAPDHHEVLLEKSAYGFWIPVSSRAREFRSTLIAGRVCSTFLARAILSVTTPTGKLSSILVPQRRRLIREG
jgi:hypothetical protein